jgi:exonuclease VII large subunit
LDEFDVPKLIANRTLIHDMQEYQRRRWVEARVEKAIKKVMQTDDQKASAFAIAHPITTPTPIPAEALYKLQEMQRIIDQLVAPALSDQRVSLESVRTVLETTNVHWEKNDHNMDALDKVQETLRGELLHMSLKVVVLYRKMMRTVEELKVMEVLKKVWAFDQDMRPGTKVKKEKMLMIELDRAVDILEGLTLD